MNRAQPSRDSESRSMGLGFRILSLGPLDEFSSLGNCADARFHIPWTGNFRGPLFS